MSGYFFGVKASQNCSISKLTYRNGKRLLFIYFSWYLIFTVLPSEFDRLITLGYFDLTHSNILQILHAKSMNLLLGPPSGHHLWFIPSLLIAMTITSAFIVLNIESLLLPFAMLLYIFGLIGGPYASTEIGIHINFYTRLGPFMATIFYAVGYQMATKWSHHVKKFQSKQLLL
jgi:surface polysaccharide O-acyltransferase-like enzyme